VLADGLTPKFFELRRKQNHTRAQQANFRICECSSPKFLRRVQLQQPRPIEFATQLPNVTAAQSRARAFCAQDRLTAGNLPANISSTLRGAASVLLAPASAPQNLLRARARRSGTN